MSLPALTSRGASGSAAFAAKTVTARSLPPPTEGSEWQPTQLSPLKTGPSPVSAVRTRVNSAKPARKRCAVSGSRDAAAGPSHCEASRSAGSGSAGQASHASPTPSRSPSTWSGFAAPGQLSTAQLPGSAEAIAVDVVAGIARVTEAVAVLVLLRGIGDPRTVVAGIADTVAVLVRLVGIRHERTAIEGASRPGEARIAEAVAVPVGAGIERIRDRVASKSGSAAIASISTPVDALPSASWIDGGAQLPTTTSETALSGAPRKRKQAPRANTAPPITRFWCGEETHSLGFSR